MRFTIKLEKILEQGADVRSFHFIPDPPAGGPLSFQAGQFLKYFLPHPESDTRGVSRYFTIASAPSESTIILATKFVPGDGSSFKQALLKLKPGDNIEAEGPSGDFTYPDPTQPVVFIAGGIGITPFRAILCELDHQNINPPITLIYANRTEEIPFKNLLDSFAAKHDQLKIDYITGLLTEDILKKYIQSPQYSIPNTLYYLSGPEPMVESLKKTLQSLSLASSQIKTDYFPGYEDEFTLFK